MSKRRLFVGLEVPPTCAETLAGLDPGVEGVHWLAAGQMYLQMSLRWYVDPEEERRLCEALDQVHVAPFFLPLQGLGTFGRAPSIAVSIGIGKGHPHFFVLHRHIQDAVIRAQIEPDLSPFHPHVTIARMTEAPEGKFLRFLRENAETEFCMWKVSGFALFARDEPSADGKFSVETRFPQN